MIHVKKTELLDLMARRGYTGAGLARAAGVTQGYLCQIINGRRYPLAPTAKKVCDALLCRFDDVFVVGGSEHD